MIANINWYPGHMKKTRELIRENLKLVDMVVEVLDARIPLSSRNPIIDELVGEKPRIIILNKSDLSDPRENDRWAARLSGDGRRVVTLNAMTGQGKNHLEKALQEEEAVRNAVRDRQKSLRLMIVGVPNVGKSSLINRLTGKKSAQTGDRPGVTRGKQWLSLPGGRQLLDTPGILWPKFEDPHVGLNLAFCGSIKDEILDQESLALELIQVLQNHYPQLLQDRYKITLASAEGLDQQAEENMAAGYEDLYDDPAQGVALANMEAIAKARGFLLPGKRIDYERCARTVLDEFRSGKIGRITLERAEEEEA